MNTVAIATQFHGKITVQLADFVDRNWFSMVLRGINFCSNSRIRRSRDKSSSQVFHGFAWKKKFLSVFGHIFIVIGMRTLSIERQIRGRKFCSNSRIRR